MSLRNNIDEDYKKAIKNKEQDKTNTLRLIKSAIKDKIPRVLLLIVRRFGSCKTRTISF